MYRQGKGDVLRGIGKICVGDKNGLREKES